MDTSKRDAWRGIRRGCHITALALLVLAWAAGEADAQRLRDRPGTGSRQARLANLVHGQRVTSRGMHYTLLPEVRAVRMARYAGDPRSMLNSIGMAGAEVLESKGGFLLFKTKPAVPTEASAKLALPNGRASYPVAFDRRTGELGIVSGALRVKLRNMDDAPGLAGDYGVRLYRRYDHIKFAIFQTGPGQDIFAVAQKLAADPRVESADAEILTYFNVPL